MQWRRRTITVKSVLAIAVLVAAIDALYLIVISPYVSKMTAAIQGSAMTMRMWAAIPVYIALALLLHFPGSASEAALIGGSAYAIYDFTNLALLKAYDPLIAIIDTAWGAVLFAATYSAMGWLGI